MRDNSRVRENENIFIILLVNDKADWSKTFRKDAWYLNLNDLL